MRAAIVLGAGVLLLASCRSVSPVSEANRPVVRCYRESGAADATTLVLPQSGVRIAVGPEPILTESDIADADLVQMELGPGLLLRLTSGAASRFAEATSRMAGGRLVLTVAGEPVATRRVDAPISNGLLFFFVEMGPTKLTKLVSDLKTHGAARPLARRLFDR